MSTLTTASHAEACEMAEAELIAMQKVGTFIPVDCPLEHLFAPGIYLRTITMAKGISVLGKEHRFAHANAVLSGSATVMMDGEVSHIKAGDVFLSRAGERKMLLIHETMRFMTIHPNDDNETDVPTLEARNVITSAAVKTLQEGGAQCPT